MWLMHMEERLPLTVNKGKAPPLRWSFLFNASLVNWKSFDSKQFDTKRIHAQEEQSYGQLSAKDEGI
jgi:hypothetical protein